MSKRKKNLQLPNSYTSHEMRNKTIDRNADLNKSLPSLNKSANCNEHYSTSQRNSKEFGKAKHTTSCTIQNSQLDKYGCKRVTTKSSLKLKKFGYSSNNKKRYRESSHTII